MHASTFEDSASSRWNWSRTCSLAAAIAVNLFGLLILARPGVVPMAAAQVVEVGIRWIDPPPEPVAVPLPPEPQPPVRAAPRPATPQPPVVTRPIVEVPSMISEPVPASDTLEQTPTVDVIASNEPAAVPRSDAALEYAHIVEPRYPRESQRRGEHGTVLLRVLVGIDGLPKQVEIARSSGYSHLDRAAREAVRQWRFRPVRINGTAVPATGLVPVAFNIADA